MGAAVKIYETIDRTPDIDSETNGKTLQEFHGAIEFKNVVFHYPSRPEVSILKSISFKVTKSHTVALVGASGSGKSTIIQLLERFYDPIDGQILVDGVPLKDFQLKWIRRKIGLVSQEPILFEGSIYDNVAHGLVGSSKEQASEKEKKELVRNACEMANAHEFIMQLTDQYNTQVGERGLLLSGGQKQRIAIARAIIKNPSILLLDEATSALDTHSERVVQEALDKAGKGRTTIVIAHRLSTIKNANKIIVMSQGEIVEEGTHQELLNVPNGYYKLLVNAQQLTKEDQTQTIKTKTIEISREKSMEESIRQTSQASIVAAEEGNRRKYSSFYILRRIVALNRKEWAILVPGLIAALVSGMVYPFFAIVFANMIQVFSKTGTELDNGAIFWSIMFLVIAIVTFVANFSMNTLFGHASEYLTERIRSLVFTNFLNQDVVFFDQESHTTGALTANLSTDAQKIQGISGVTIGSLLTVLTNLVGGAIVALIFGWKLGLTAIACLPILVFSGFFRIYIITYFAEKAKGAYEKSAQLACEAVAAIRTIQALTRESNVFELYHKIILKPHHDGIKSAYYNTTMYAFSQCVNFLVNALVFWYGGRLIAYEGYTVSQMFTVFIAVVFGSMGAGRIFAYSPDMQKAKEAGENIIHLLDSKSTIDAHSDFGKKLESIQGLIEFKDVLVKWRQILMS
jgi:ABC-type multidrug transport system fused ATPase/permease subunit